MFALQLEILPPPQQRLWPELAATPAEFTLYGGTAIALRLGHRYSVDFDFFSPTAFDPHELRSRVPYLAGGTLRQSAPNNLTVTVDRGGPVQVSFFGGMKRIGQVAANDIAEGPRLAVASLLDLAGMKVAVESRRVELKDYLDIHALMTRGNLSLGAMLSAAAAIYGESFVPLIALKAISYHHEPALADLPLSVRGDLVSAVRNVDIDALPSLKALRPWKNEA